MSEKVCGTCTHHRCFDHRVNDGTHFNDFTEWYCTNEQSEANGCETEYQDACECWEGR